MGNNNIDNPIAAELFSKMIDIRNTLPATEGKTKITSILFSNRAGSTYLSSLLNLKHGETCFAGEFLSPQWLSTAQKNYDLSPCEVIELLIELSKRKKSIFLKFSYFHYVQLKCQFPEVHNLIINSKIVRLKRKDTKAQVMSRIAARASGSWHQLNDGTNIVYMPSNLYSDPVTEVMQAVAFTVGCEVGWDIFIKDHCRNSHKLTIHYEEFTKKPLQTLNSLEKLSSLPITDSLDLSDSSLHKKSCYDVDLSLYEMIFDKARIYLDNFLD